MTNHKLYSVLGLDKGASADEIKKAYRKKALELHPDKPTGDAEKFKEVNAAYEVLSDAQKKQQYDELGDAGITNQGGGMPPDINEMFANLFNGTGFGFPGGNPFGFRQGPIRRQDIVHNVSITLHDAYFGLKKNIKIKIDKTCFKCQTQCPACQGRGQITDMRRIGPMTQMMTRICDICKGSGNVTNGNCQECTGGKHAEERKVELDIPRGVQTGYQIRINQCGEQAKTADEIPGDLIFQVNIIQHEKYERREADLVCVIPITFTESILGKQLTMPHFTGDITVDIEKFTVVQPEKKYIVEGKGMPRDPQGKTFGNLILQFHISYPSKTWTAEERTMLETTFKTVGL